MYIKIYALADDRVTQRRFNGEKMDEKKVIINEKKPTDLLTADFDYCLPESLIAQHPMEKRDHSRLMVLDRETGTIDHKHFYDILDYINPEDVLVINDSKVIPARLYGHVEGSFRK